MCIRDRNSRVIKEECKENRNQEPVLAITFTSVLAALYLVFSMIQIVYLFMGQMKLPEGDVYKRQLLRWLLPHPSAWDRPFI